jgi:hypothetical protein
LIDLHALAAQLLQERVEIVDAKVHHEGFLTGRKVIGVSLEGRPNGVSLALRFEICRGALVKSNASIFFNLQAKMFLVPSAQFLWIVCFEEDSRRCR